MELFKLHTNPKSLVHYDTITETHPDFFWEKYWDKPNELKKREKYIVKYARYSYIYAKDYLDGPFLAGEETIAKNVNTAYDYAKYVLTGPFPAGEALIAKDSLKAYMYAKYVIKKDFYLDGKLIAKAD